MCLVFLSVYCIFPTCFRSQCVKKNVIRNKTKIHQNTKKTYIFIELCHSIYPNSTAEGMATKLSQTFQQPLKSWWHNKYKSRHGWTNLKKIETDCNWGYGKPVSLTVFQRSFLLFVMFDIMLGRPILLEKRCDFVILKFHSE